MPLEFFWLRDISIFETSMHACHACHAKSCGVMTSTSWFQPYRRKLAPMAKIGRGFELLVYRVISNKFIAWLEKRLLLIPSCVQRLRKKKSLNSEDVWNVKKKVLCGWEGVKMKKIWELKLWKCWENLWRFRAVPMCGWEGLRMWIFWNKKFWFL